MTITNSDIIDGTIIQSEMGYAKAEFTLKEGTSVALDEKIQFTEDYTSLSSTTTPVIFDGRIENKSLTDVVETSATSEQDEVVRIQPFGSYQGLTTVNLSKIVDDNKDFIKLNSYGPTTWTGYFDAPYNFSNQTGLTRTEIDWIDKEEAPSGGHEIEATLNDGDGQSGSLHNKCLKITHITGGGDFVEHDFGGARSSGTVEWWWYDGDVSDGAKIYFYAEDSIVCYLFIENTGKIYYNNNTTKTKLSDDILTDATWYRFKVIWNGDNTWDLYLYGNDLVEIASITGVGTYTDNVDPTKCRIQIAYYFSHIAYLDAWGESWINNYNVGDNASEITYNLPASTYLKSQSLSGGQTLQSLLTEGAMTEQDVWALAPDGDLRWHDGTNSSGVILDGTQKVWDVSATQQVKRINRVILKGAGGLEAVWNDTARQTSSGQIIIYKDYRADIDNQTDLDTLASQIGDVQKDPPLAVQLSLQWEAKGWIQVGETIHIEADSYKYNRSSSYIPHNDYRIRQITYHIKDGAYHYIELDLEDGLQYIIQTQEDKIDHNTQNANSAYGGTVVSGGGGGGGGGLNNIVEDTTPQLGGDLDSNAFDININNANHIYFGAGTDGDAESCAIYTDLNNDRLYVRAEETDSVATFTSYGMILPKTGETATMYVYGSIFVGYGENGRLKTGTDYNLLVETQGTGALSLKSGSGELAVTSGIDTAKISLTATTATTLNMTNATRTWGFIGDNSPDFLGLYDYGDSSYAISFAGAGGTITVDRALSMSSNKISSLTAGSASGEAVEYDQLHSESHIVGSSGPHSASGLTTGHVLRATGATSFDWQEIINNDAYDGAAWNNDETAATKDAIRDVIDPLTSAMRYSGLWTAGTDKYPEAQTDGTVGSTAGTSIFTDATKDFTALGVLVGDILNIREGVDLGFYVIDIVGTTTVTCTGDTFGTVSNLEYQIFRAVGGEYWICDADGVYDDIWYEVGDWLIWNDTEIQWDRIRNSFGDNIIAVSPGDNIQTAIDEVVAIGEGVIYLNPGTHVLTATLTIDDPDVDITIRGNYDATIIDINGDRTAFDIDQAYSCVLENFRIDTSDAVTTLLVIIDIDEALDNRVICENIHIVGDAGKDGIGFEINSNNVEVLSCIVDYIWEGIRCYGSKITVDRNIFKNADVRGIYLAPSSSQINISHNFIDTCGSGSNQHAGIMVDDVTFCNINNNLITACNGAGVEIRLGTQNSIISNTIWSITGEGILAGSNEDYSLISDNNISSCSTYGISILSGNDYITIGPNSFYNNTSGNINNGESTTIIMADDTAYNATSWNGNLGTATKNVIRDEIEDIYTDIAAIESKSVGIADAYGDQGAIVGFFASNPGVQGGVYMPGSDSDARANWSFHKIPAHAAGTFSLKIEFWSDNLTPTTYSGLWSVTSQKAGDTIQYTGNIINASNAYDLSMTDDWVIYTQTIPLTGISVGDTITVYFISDTSNSRFFVLRSLWIEWTG
jgi:hypothetical protein